MKNVSVNVMQDLSEIVPYDEAGIPLYVRQDQLNRYPDKKALCHWHEDLEFIRVTSGEMGYYINGKHLVLKENDGVVVNTRQMHYGSSIDQKDCSFLCILIHPALFSANRTLYRKYISPLLDSQAAEFMYLDSRKPEQARILNAISQAAALKEGAKPGYELEIIGLFFMIWKDLFQMMEAQSPFPSGNGSPEAKLQKDMVSFIYQHYTEKLTLASIAAAGGVCRSKCCQIFKKYLSQSPIDFLNAYRLEVSSLLLKNTEKSITDIALECGFNHSSYYTELFVRAYGCTPRQFRRQTPA